MEIRYKTKKLEKKLISDKGMKKAYGTLAKKINQRRAQLEAAEHLGIINKLPALRLHPHKGENKGIWSIDIHKNWRILFTLENDPLPTLEDGGVDINKITIIKIASVEDPH